MEMVQSLAALLIIVGVIILVYKYRKKMELQKMRKERQSYKAK